MRRHMKLLLPIVALALVAAACGDDDGGSEAVSGDDLGGREVTVGVENLYPPFNYIPTDSTEGAGWDYDVWREICNRLNCTAGFVEAAWPDVIVEVGLKSVAESLVYHWSAGFTAYDNGHDASGSRFGAKLLERAFRR